MPSFGALRFLAAPAPAPAPASMLEDTNGTVSPFRVCPGALRPFHRFAHPGDRNENKQPGRRSMHDHRTLTWY